MAAAASAQLRTNRLAGVDAIRSGKAAGCDAASAVPSAPPESVLLASLAAIGQGVAIVDDQDRFIFWNAPYENLHPRIKRHLRVGRSVAEYLTLGLAEGAFADAIGREEAWLAERIAERSVAFLREQELADGRWLRVEGTPLPNGGAVTVAVDITEHKLREEALRAARSSLDSIVENMPTALLVRDADDGTIMLTNKAGEALFGRSRAEMVGRRPHDVFPPHEVGHLIAGDHAALASRAVGVFPEQPFATRHGLRYVRTRKLALPSATPRGADLLISICEDTTEQRASEKALRDSERKWSSLFHGIGDPIMVLRGGKTGPLRFEDFNEACARVFGAPVEELAGQPVDRLRPALRRRAKAVLEACLLSGRTVQLETRLALPTGRRLFHFAVHPVVDGLNWERRVWVIATDLTEQRSAAVALRDREEQLTRLFESTTDAMAIMQVENGRWQFWRVNAPHCRLVGRTAEETVGLTHADVIDPGHAGYVTEHLLECARTRRQIDFETEYEHQGALHGVRTTYTPMLEGSGPVRRILLVVKDTTEQVQAKRRLEESQKFEAIGQLAGGVAHDFNNLLLIMDGYAREALDAAARGAPVDEPLAEVLGAAQRGARLVKQLLVFSRRQVTDTRVVRLLDVLDESQSLLKPLMGERFSLTVKADAAARRACIETDPTELTQALVNLSTNARDAMPRGGDIDISLALREVDDALAAAKGVSPGTYAAISLSDTGSGIPRDVLAKIFDPFFTTKEPGKGTGLGLAMVYGFVQQSGGFLEVETEVGQGTTFRILLPTAEGEPSIDAAVIDDDCFGQGETVLLVEDDEAILRLIRKTLEDLGYKVLTATNGMEALEVEMGHDGPLDLVLSDMVMPILGGLELKDMIAATRPGAPVVFMSGYPTRGEADAVAIPEDALFLQKPFRPADLARTLRRALGGEVGSLAAVEKDVA